MTATYDSQTDAIKELENYAPKIKEGGIIHFYDFLKEEEFSQAEKKIKSACDAAGVSYRKLNLVKCGQFGPGIFRICLDVQIGAG